MTRRISITLLVLVLCLTALDAQAANPFLSKSKSTQSADTTQKQQAPAEKRAPAVAPGPWMPGFLAPVMHIVSAWQKTIKRQITGFARDMQEKPLGSSFFLFLLLSFVYGVIHAIGPGHGKSVVMSFFLNRPGSIWQGIVMGHLITAVHVTSGVLVVLVMMLFFDTTRIADFESASPKLEMISYALVIIIGLYLAIHTIMDIREMRNRENTPPPTTGTLRDMLLTATATGLVPCPGAALILLFSIIMGVMVQGLAAMVAIALGMGLTTSLFALLAIGSRNAVLAVAGKNQKAFVAAYGAVSFGGAAFIMLLGGIMLAGSLG